MTARERWLRRIAEGAGAAEAAAGGGVDLHAVGGPPRRYREGRMRDASSDTRDCNALRPTLDAAQAATRPRTPARGAGRNPPGRPGAHRPRYAATPSAPGSRRAGGRGEGRDGGRTRGHRAARAATANVPEVRPRPRRGAAGTVSSLRGPRARTRGGPVRAWTVGSGERRPMPVDDIISHLKRFGEERDQAGGRRLRHRRRTGRRARPRERPRALSARVRAGLHRGSANESPTIAWSLPHAIREAASGFEFDTLRGLSEDQWTSVLASSGHRLATEMERLLPAAIGHIGDRYGGDASRIWASGSSGAAVARRFLAFDGVGPKIANMAVNILIRDFGIHLTRPMPDIAVDTHVLRVFERLGLLGRLDHSQLRSTQGKQQLRLQLRARELNPEWPGELDWPAWLIGRSLVSRTGAHPSATNAT